MTRTLGNNFPFLLSAVSVGKALNTATKGHTQLQLPLALQSRTDGPCAFRLVIVQPTEVLLNEHLQNVLKTRHFHILD